MRKKPQLYQYITSKNNKEKLGLSDLHVKYGLTPKYPHSKRTSVVLPERVKTTEIAEYTENTLTPKI